jgi:replicative DNA helicase
MVISAPTSCGKSQLALNVALKTAISDGKGVAIFSFEMPSEQIMKRMTQISSGKNIAHTLTKLEENKEKDFIEIDSSIQKLQEANIHIIHYVKGITELKAKCRQLKRKHDIELIVIDYLQLITWDRRMSKCDGIAEVSHGIKQMAMELDLPVILLAQINREGAKSGKPNIYSLKDSGDVENDADIILMMYPKNVDLAQSKKLDKNGKPYVELEYKLVKNREGERDVGGIFVFDNYVGRFL